jgi:hypothetical protein
MGEMGGSNVQMPLPGACMRPIVDDLLGILVGFEKNWLDNGDDDARDFRKSLEDLLNDEQLKQKSLKG